jgi:hypothetical protein
MIEGDEKRCKVLMHEVIELQCACVTYECMHDEKEKLQLVHTLCIYIHHLPMKQFKLFRKLIVEKEIDVTEFHYRSLCNIQAIRA